MDSSPARAYGVFKPVGHMVVSFPTAAQADDGMAALQALNLPEQDVRRYTDREMLAQIDQDLRQASPVAAVGQELNLVKAHQALAERGYHWLVVRVDSDEAARNAADALKAAGAEVIEVVFPLVSNCEGDRPGAPTVYNRGIVSKEFLHDELWELSAWAFDDFLREKLLALGLVQNVESRIVIRSVKSTTAAPLGLVSPHLGES